MVWNTPRIKRQAETGQSELSHNKVPYSRIPVDIESSRPMQNVFPRELASFCLGGTLGWSFMIEVLILVSEGSSVTTSLFKESLRSSCLVQVPDFHSLELSLDRRGPLFRRRAVRRKHHQPPGHPTTAHPPGRSCGEDSLSFLFRGSLPSSTPRGRATVLPANSWWSTRRHGKSLATINASRKLWVV